MQLRIPFTLCVKTLDPKTSQIDVLEFLPDEPARELFCRLAKVSRDDLNELGTDLGMIYSALYTYRERLYYQDLQAAAAAARGITDGVFSVLGEMVYVFKRLMLDVYGIQTDMRDRFLEEELFEKSPSRCGIIFCQSYEMLRDFIAKTVRA